MTTATPDRAIIAEALRKIDDLTARLQAAQQASTLDRASNSGWIRS